MFNALNRLKASSKKGFTLIEILVVLVIIAVLVAILLPNTLKAIRTANVKQNNANINNINAAVKLCYNETKTWASCDSAAELTAPPTSGGDPYLANFPTDPISGGTYGFVTDPDTGGVRVDTTGHVYAD